MGALNNLQFTGSDFFTGKDVCSIVLEVPSAAFGHNKIGLWHRTLDGASGMWVQADRGALPSQSVFLTGERKADYLAAAVFTLAGAHGWVQPRGGNASGANPVAGHPLV